MLKYRRYWLNFSTEPDGRVSAAARRTSLPSNPWNTSGILVTADDVNSRRSSRTGQTKSWFDATIVTREPCRYWSFFLLGNTIVTELSSLEKERSTGRVATNSPNRHIPPKEIMQQVTSTKCQYAVLPDR